MLVRVPYNGAMSDVTFLVGLIGSTIRRTWLQNMRMVRTDDNGYLEVVAPAGAMVNVNLDAIEGNNVVQGGVNGMMPVMGDVADGGDVTASWPVKIGAVARSAPLGAVLTGKFVNLITDLNRRLRTLPEGATADGAADGGLNPLKLGAVVDQVLTALADGQTAQLITDLYRRLYTNPQGGVADDAVDDGTNPVKVGAVADAVLAVVADGDRVQLVTDLYRRLQAVIAGYDSGANTNRTYEVSPLNLQVLEESLVDATNVAVGTPNYPSDDGLVMMGYKDFSITGKFICGADNTVTVTVLGTNDEDATPANRDWIQLFAYRVDTNAVVNSIVCGVSTTVTFAWDFDNCNYRYVRVHLAITNAGALSNTIILKIRRKAL